MDVKNFVKKDKEKFRVSLRRRKMQAYFQKQRMRVSKVALTKEEKLLAAKKDYLLDTCKKFITAFNDKNI